MSFLKDMLLSFLGLHGVDDRRAKPRDLREFEAAKKRLRANSRAFSKELDQFGDLVQGMQHRSYDPADDTPRNERPKGAAVKKAKKVKPKKRSRGR